MGNRVWIYEGYQVAASPFHAQNMASPSPHWFPGPTELGVSTADFLDIIGLALLFFIYSLPIFDME